MPTPINPFSKHVAFRGLEALMKNAGFQRIESEDGYPRTIWTDHQGRTVSCSYHDGRLLFGNENGPADDPYLKYYLHRYRLENGVVLALKALNIYDPTVYSDLQIMEEIIRWAEEKNPIHPNLCERIAAWFRS